MKAAARLLFSSKSHAVTLFAQQVNRDLWSETRLIQEWNKRRAQLEKDYRNEQEREGTPVDDRNLVEFDRVMDRIQKQDPQSNIISAKLEKVRSEEQSTFLEPTSSVK